MTAYARPHDLIESFLSEAWETTGELESAPFLLGHAEGMHRLVVASHRLKGSAGLYQYAEVSSLAGLLERVFESAHLFNAEERKLALDFSAQVTAVLSEALERIQTTGDEGQPGLSLAALGGGDLLQRLLVKNPSHFKRSEAQMGASLGFIEEIPTPAPAPVPVATDPTDQVIAVLQNFFKQQPEVWEYFAPEVLENLELVAHGLDNLDPQDPTNGINEMFRGFHTVKGASYSVGCEPLGKLAHRLEDALVLVRDHSATWNDQFGNAVAQSIDALSRMVATAEGRDVGLGAALIATHNALDVVLGVQTLKPEPTVSLSATAPITTSAAQSEVEATPNATLRVGINRLERVLNLSGEVLLTRARFDNFSRRLEELSELFANSRSRLESTSLDISERFGSPKLLLEDATKLPEDSSKTSPQDEEAKPQSALQSQLIEDVQAMFSELEFDRYDDSSLIARAVAEVTADIGELQQELDELGNNFRREAENFEKLTRNLRLEAGRLRLVPFQGCFSACGDRFAAPPNRSRKWCGSSWWVKMLKLTIWFWKVWWIRSPIWSTMP
jgi:chemosensory pili system protein ChpA (sensor histidine kinase/response regulator)